MSTGDDHLDPEILAKIRQAKESESISLDDLKVGDFLEVHTTNSIYSITMVEPKEGLATVRSTNNKFFAADNCFILGSNLRGGVVFFNKIIIGFNLVIGRVGSTERWNTSAIRSVRLNPQQISG